MPGPWVAWLGRSKQGYSAEGGPAAQDGGLCPLGLKELLLLVKLMGLVDTAVQDTGQALRFKGGYRCLT